MTDLKHGISAQVLAYRSVLAVLWLLLLFQYLHNRSLWIDEANLSLNIIDRNFAGLLRPLDYNQVAPILFLQVEKLFVTIFGNSEPALRMFPLICAFVSLPLFYALCFRFTANRTLSLCALILLGCAPQFIYYSSEVKQYAVDVAVLLGIYYVAFINSPFLIRWRTLALSLVGILGIFLSNVSIIVLFTLGLLYVYRSWRAKKILPAYGVPVVLWTIFFGINYMLFVRDHPSTDFMKAFWKNSFMPWNIFDAPFRRWMNKSIFHVFRDLLPSLPGGYLYVGTLVLYAVGLVLMLRKKELRLLYVCAVPVLIHILLSALKIYPFELRLILYQLPLYIIVLAYGAWFISGYLAQRSSLQPVVLSIITALLSFRLLLNFPIDHDEIKPAIQYVNQYGHAGESIYIFRGSAPSTRYYMKTGLAKFDSLRIEWAAPKDNSSASNLDELNAVKGRAWLLMSHMFPFNGSRDQENEIVQALQKRGTLLRRCQFEGTAAYEFDLR